MNLAERRQIGGKSGQHQQQLQYANMQLELHEPLGDDKLSNFATFHRSFSEEEKRWPYFSHMADFQPLRHRRATVAERWSQSPHLAGLLVMATRVLGRHLGA